ncbi:MAG: hypothetical protein PVH61_37165 [Candidatus Aminicenantes bacterium]|jgi:hypothetical protein
MKVMTQLGPLDINPADVVSIRPAPVIPDNMDDCDLTYYVEFDDRFYDIGDLVVCISESDAKKLAELSGIEIERKKEKSRPDYPQASAPETHGRKTIFVPFKEQIVLNEWEKHFDENIAWKKGRSQEPDSRTQPATFSFSSGCKLQNNRNCQPKSLIEKAFQEQEKGPA